MCKVRAMSCTSLTLWSRSAWAGPAPFGESRVAPLVFLAPPCKIKSSVLMTCSHAPMPLQSDAGACQVPKAPHGEGDLTSPGVWVG